MTANTVEAAGDEVTPSKDVLEFVGTATLGSAPTVLAEQLRRAVFKLATPPGTRLFTLGELVRRTGYSAGVVREAIQQLHSEGIVEVRQGNCGGVFTRRVDAGALARSLEGLITSNQISDETVIEARQQIEAACARLAALHATKMNLTSLRESINRMKSLTGLPTEFAAEAVRFHLLISEASGNGVLIAITSGLRELFHTEYVGLHYRQKDLEKAVLAHQRIYDDISRNRPDAAQDAVVRHLDGFAEATWRTRHGNSA